MFETLTKGFRTAKQKFQGLAELDEKTIDEALGDVRTSCSRPTSASRWSRRSASRCSEKAVGVIVKVRATSKEKVRRVTPEDHFVKLCHDELVHLMGPVDSDLRFAKKGPTGIMMVGLQGSGKTTTVGKLARYLEKRGRRPLLVAADVYRPAAIEQLQVLGEDLGMPVFAEPGGSPPLICEKAHRFAAEHGRDTVIFDTAGRLAIDEPLMNELKEIKRRTNPANIFFVIDAMIGQDAVATAKTFHDWLDYDGVILTKLDGDARGGAALSVKAVTGKPVKFVGMGESLDRLEEFRPDGMASRILGPRRRGRPGAAVRGRGRRGEGRAGRPAHAQGEVRHERLPRADLDPEEDGAAVRDGREDPGRRRRQHPGRRQASWCASARSSRR